MKKELRASLQVAAILFAGICIYWPAIHGANLWDDSPAWLSHLEFNLAGLVKIWSGAVDFNYYPLKATVQWIQWHLWGEDTLGFHLTNVGFHVLSALLFWRLLARLGVRWAWFGGLLFAVHPLAVESVAWMAEIKNTLSLPPLLLAMIAFVSYDENKSAGKLVLSLLCFLAAMLCKTSVVMFPVVLLLYCWWKRGRIGLADLRASAAFFVISLIFGLVEIRFQQRVGIAGENLNIGGIFSRLAAAGLSVGFYLWKFLVPIRLMPAYPRWDVVPPSPAQFLPWLALGALVGWLWTKRASWGRGALFGLGVFGVNVLPVLGLIPMAYLRISWVADHFVYVPMLGLAGLVAGGAGMLVDRLARTQRGLSASLAVFAAIVLCALGFASHRYAAIFRDSGALWSYELQQNPNAWIAHHNLANLYFTQPGQEVNAIAHYEAALRLKPDLAEAHNNLALLLVKQPARQAEAINHYETALRIDPNYAEAHNNLALLLAKQPARQAEAIAHYETALRINPDYAEAHNNLAVLLASEPGRQADAIAHLEAALRIRPDYVNALYNLAVLLSAQPGRQAEAALHFKAVLKIDPDNAPAKEALQQLQRNDR